MNFWASLSCIFVLENSKKEADETGLAVKDSAGCQFAFMPNPIWAFWRRFPFNFCGLSMFFAQFMIAQKCRLADKSIGFYLLVSSGQKKLLFLAPHTSLKKGPVIQKRWSNKSIRTQCINTCSNRQWMEKSVDAQPDKLGSIAAAMENWH